MKTQQRPVSSVPRWILWLLAASLLAQIGWKARIRPDLPTAEDLPPPPGIQALRIAALGEPATLARIAMLYLQAFDYHGSNTLPYGRLDYGRLIGWLSAIQQLDTRSEYPLFAASRIYAEVPDPRKQRLMLEFIYREFLKDPDRRWPWAAQAALVAKHQLKDLPLALKIARAIERHTNSKDVPHWAKQMEVFILEDMNELDAARVLLGAMLESGRINDPAERRFLEGRLKEMESRAKALHQEKGSIQSNGRQS